MKNKCPVCGGDICGGYGRIYCGETCRKSARNQRDRAKRRGERQAKCDEPPRDDPLWRRWEAICSKLGRKN